MATLTITATVDDDDLAQFLADDPDLAACVRARMNEVFGDHGAVLTTVDVRAVEVGRGDPDACEHPGVTCLDCGEQTA